MSWTTRDRSRGGSNFGGVPGEGAGLPGHICEKVF